jgi:hypothetical protein
MVQPNPGNVMLACNSEKTPNGPWRGCPSPACDPVISLIGPGL